MTLTEFLLARIAEDEAWATACEGLHWQWVGDESDVPLTPEPMLSEYLYGTDDENVSLRSVETFPDGSMPGEGPRFFISTDEVSTAAAGHVARHDPARVLAECEAKRRIVDLFAADIPDEWRGYPSRPMKALAHLALPYADHPDYDNAWRP